MFDKLIEDLIGAGLTEAEIGKAIGRSQATVNRVRNGKQQLGHWEAVEALRKLHAARAPAPAEARS
jgi:IS30 family transposase